IRGEIALIRKGSGMIVGLADLVRSSGPLDKQQMLSSIEKHRIPVEMINSGQVDKWQYAWELNSVRRLEHPVPYSHPRGAVIWVNLESRTYEQVQRQALTSPSAPSPGSLVEVKVMTKIGQASLEHQATKGFVPFARDNSCFNRSLGS